MIFKKLYLLLFLLGNYQNSYCNNEAVRSDILNHIQAILNIEENSEHTIKLYEVLMKDIDSFFDLEITELVDKAKDCINKIVATNSQNIFISTNFLKTTAVCSAHSFAQSSDKISANILYKVYIRTIFEYRQEHNLSTINDIQDREIPLEFGKFIKRISQN